MNMLARKLVVPVAIAAIVAVALILALSAPAGHAGEPANTMSVDTDAGTIGVQTTRTLTTLDPFQIAIVSSSINIPYGGYQVSINFEDSVLNFVSGTVNDDGSAVWDSQSTNMPLCAPINDSPDDPPNRERWGNSGGCAGFSSGSFAGNMALMTLQCVAIDGTTTTIHLDALAETTFGTSFFDTGGSALDTDLSADVTINCGVPPTPTPTPIVPTDTPTPTDTPSPTDTPTETNTPTVTNTPTITPTPTNTPVGTPEPPLIDMDLDGLTDDEEIALDSCPGLQTKFQPLGQCHVGGVLAQPLISDPTDTDGDGLVDGVEFYTYGTDPTDSDSDNDGLADGDEVLTHGSAPINLDTDVDGLSDGVETAIHTTSPVMSNTDGDGCRDNQELGINRLLGGDRNPLSPWDFYDVPVPALEAGDTTGVRNRVINIADVLAVLFYTGVSSGGGPNGSGVDYDDDLNGNGTPDGQEYDRSVSANLAKPWRSGPPTGAVSISDVLVALIGVGDKCSDSPSPPLDDNDGDGISDFNEIGLGTCPGIAPAFSSLPQCLLIPDPTDTDGDDVADNIEVLSVGSDPLDTDSDNDTLDDGEEVNDLLTDPLVVDTDIDGLGDGDEHQTHGTSGVSPHTDGDWCGDRFEVGINPVLGGDRDPLNPYDFFDVPVPAYTIGDPSGTRNFAVTISDVLGVLFYSGTSAGSGPNGNGVDYDDDVDGNDVPDGREYDRAVSLNPAKPWRSSLPNGVVSITDVLVALSQVGHHCTD